MKNKSFLISIILIMLAACNPMKAPQPPASQTIEFPTSTTGQDATQAGPMSVNTIQPSGEDVPAVIPADAGAMVSSGELWLIVLVPQDGDTVSSPTILVTGQAPAETVISINDQLAITSADQTFELEISLEAGMNLLEIVASDLNGYEIYLPLTVDYEP